MQNTANFAKYIDVKIQWLRYRVIKVSANDTNYV